jgi:hypothetical protein
MCNLCICDTIDNIYNLFAGNKPKSFKQQLIEDFTYSEIVPNGNSYMFNFSNNNIIINIHISTITLLTFIIILYILVFNL